MGRYRAVLRREAMEMARGRERGRLGGSIFHAGEFWELQNDRLAHRPPRTAALAPAKIYYLELRVRFFPAAVEVGRAEATFLEEAGRALLFFLDATDDTGAFSLTFSRLARFSIYR